MYYLKQDSTNESKIQKRRQEFLRDLWLIRVRNLEFFNGGNWSLSRNRGLASINFFSSASIIPLADLVSPYLDSCSLSLQINYLKKEKKEKPMKILAYLKKYGLWSLS